MSIVLEPEASKLSDTVARLDKATGRLAKEGMWARMLKVSQPTVTVGPNQLPSQVPASNIPRPQSRKSSPCVSALRSVRGRSLIKVQLCMV